MVSQAESAVTKPPLPTLEDVANLTRDSDYAPFVARQVDPQVRNAAMKKLFSDPHFNVMDGLDTYIDDYGKPDPLPLSMLRQMTSALALGLFADEEKVPEKATPDGAPSDALAQSLPDEPQAPHEDTDLRLQPDDAAGRRGADPRAGSEG